METLLRRASKGDQFVDLVSSVAKVYVGVVGVFTGSTWEEADEEEGEVASTGEVS